MNARTFALMAAVVLTGPALAHEVEKGPNGGRVTDAGDYHVELVAKENLVEVFVSDSKNEVVTLAGFKGVAILLVDGKQKRITLDGSTPGRLTGKITSTKATVLKGVVQLTTPQGGSVQARFK